MDKAYELTATEQDAPRKDGISSAQAELIVFQIRQVRGCVMQVENRLVATYVSGITSVIHHQHTTVSRWRSLCELVKADCGGELELSAMTFVEHSLHKVIIESACG